MGLSTWFHPAPSPFGALPARWSGASNAGVQRNLSDQAPWLLSWQLWILGPKIPHKISETKLTTCWVTWHFGDSNWKLLRNFKNCPFRLEQDFSSRISESWMLGSSCALKTAWCFQPSIHLKITQRDGIIRDGLWWQYCILSSIQPAQLLGQSFQTWGKHFTQTLPEFLSCPVLASPLVPKFGSQIQWTKKSGWLSWLPKIMYTMMYNDISIIIHKIHKSD